MMSQAASAAVTTTAMTASAPPESAESGYMATSRPSTATAAAFLPPFGPAARPLVTQLVRRNHSGPHRPSLF